MAMENCALEYCQSSTKGPGCTRVRTAPMTTAARTARGSDESTGENGTSRATTPPVMKPLQRVRAPARWLRAVREKEPPTG